MVDAVQGDEIYTQMMDLMAQLGRHEFPRLQVEEVTDDGETFMALRCPRCGNLVDSDDLYAVDFAERWTSAEEFYEGMFDHRLVEFYYDDIGEFGDVTFYRHDSHAVSLPEGWAQN